MCEGGRIGGLRAGLVVCGVVFLGQYVRCPEWDSNLGLKT